MLPTTDPGLRQFVDWLKDTQAQPLNPTSQWEVQRWRTDHGHMILYQNAKGERKWVNSSGLTATAEVLKAFSNHRDSPKKEAPAPGAPGKASVRRTRRNHPFKERLLHRQGGKCFYCGCDIAVRPRLTEGVVLATVEHFVALSSGGPDEFVNMVAACEPCNVTAGRKTVWEKVLMRESLHRRRNAE